MKRNNIADFASEIRESISNIKYWHEKQCEIDDGCSMCVEIAKVTTLCAEPTRDVNDLGR